MNLGLKWTVVKLVRRPRGQHSFGLGISRIVLLPLALLGIRSSPITGRGSTGRSSSTTSTSSDSTGPLVRSAVPVTLSTRETSGGSLPIASGSEGTGVNGGSANLVGTGNLLLLDLLLGLGFRIAVCSHGWLVGKSFTKASKRRDHQPGYRRTEVQIDHDVPRNVAARNGATDAEDFTREHPPDAADGVATLVVGGDGDIDVLGGRVSVTEGDDGDVDV